MRLLKTGLAIGAMIAGVLFFPSVCNAEERVYAESSMVGHEVQDVIFEVLEEEDYRDMDPDVAYLVVSLIEKESQGEKYAVSKTGDHGLCQIHIAVHRDRMARLGVTDIYDEKQNVRMCVDILDDLFDEYDGWTRILMHYNGTRNADERYRSGDYTEYAETVMDRYYEIKNGVESEKKALLAEEIAEKTFLERLEREEYISNFTLNVPCIAGVSRETMQILGGSIEYYKSVYGYDVDTLMGPWTWAVVHRAL